MIEEELEINLIYKQPKVGMCILLNRHLPRVFLFECVLKVMKRRERGNLNLSTQHTRLKKSQLDIYIYNCYYHYYYCDFLE